MGAIQLIQISPEELQNSFITALESKITALEERLNSSKPTELMTKKEVCEYFKVSSVSIWKWTRDNKLKGYMISGKVYYKRHEIEASLISL